MEKSVRTPKKPVLKKIISGGQTGVDRGALDAAIAANRPHGGKCPRGRLAEDGRIPWQYKLEELDSYKYRVRTEANVLDADGTLLLYWRSLSGGTEYTYRMARKHQKPYYLYDFAAPKLWEDLVDWIRSESIQFLNVAGPRESSCPGIHQLTLDLMTEVLSRI